MKNTIITTLSVIVFVGGFLALYFSGPKIQSVPVINQPAQQASDTQKWETKTDDQASVTVTVTPTPLGEMPEEWKFDIIMDTHSVELDQDMTKVAILIDEQGKEYKAKSWDGPVGGHHREGLLTFSKITPIPKSVELKISDIGGVVRTFNWQLK